MSFESGPELQALIRQAEVDITGRVAGDVAHAGLFERRLARVIAGAAHGVHGRIDWAARQLLPVTADEVGVLRWSDVLGLARVQAAKAEGTLVVRATPGTEVPADTRWTRRDGVEYRSLDAATLTASEGEIQVEAVVAAANGNTPSTTAVSLVGNVPGLWPDAVFGATGARGGRDIERVEALKWRVVERFRSPARGGGAGDYEAWALEVPGVAAAQEKPLWLGPGTVGVFVYGPDVDESVVAAVQTHLDDVAPVTARVTVLRPSTVLVPVDATLEPDDSETRERVERSIIAVFERLAPGDTLRRSHLHAALVESGVDWYELRAPASDVECAPHERAAFGGWQ